MANHSVNMKAKTGYNDTMFTIYIHKNSYMASYILPAIYPIAIIMFTNQPATFIFTITLSYIHDKVCEKEHVCEHKKFRICV